MKNKDQLFMNIAKLISQKSSCISIKVGCVIVKDQRIISMGYNGTPSGYINCNQYFEKNQQIIQNLSFRQYHHQWSNIHEIHAEMNAIMFAARKGISVDGATLYSTVFPCQHCLKNIVQSGIISVIYINDYDLGQYDQKFMKFIRSQIEIKKIKQ